MKHLLLIPLLLLMTLCGCVAQQVEQRPLKSPVVSSNLTAPTITVTVLPPAVTITAPPVIEYIEVIKEVEKIVTVNQTVEVLVFTDNISGWIIKWKSQDEVRQYYKSVRVDMVQAMGDDIKRWDCDDWAMWLSHRALQDRRQIGLMTIIRGTQGHMLNFVTIGNRVYQIEPQNGNVNPPAGYDYTLD